MDELAKVMADLEQSMARIRQLPPLDPKVDFKEIDKDRTVEVHVDELGKISSIKVATGWESRLEADQLQERINETLARATSRIVGIDPDGDFGEPTKAGKKAEPYQLPSLGPVEDVEVSEQDKAAARDYSDKIYAQFVKLVEYTSDHPAEINEDIQRRFDELDEVLAAPIDSVEERFFSENRMVSIAGYGGSVGDVQISPNWLVTQRSGLTITQCLSEALAQAPQEGSEFSDVMSSLFKF